MQPKFNQYTCALMVIGLFVQLSCKVQRHAISPDSGYTQYTGRIERSMPGATKLYWPGTSIKTKFKGTALKATLKDEKGCNRYAVIIDDDSSYTLRINSTKKTYTLVSGLPPGEHTVTLHRLTDWFEGITTFYGFEYETGVTALPLSIQKRSIEFYGNSITVGAGMLERDTLIRRTGISTNNYLSYGALVARHYNAIYTCIASSGIGLMVSWGSLIMPDIYNRLNPADSTSHWDFSKSTPDIVVVNLLQNDFALFGIPEHEQYKKRFGTKAPDEETIVANYKLFITQLRNHYPKTHIICALGSMDAVQPGSAWPGYIKKAVSSIGDKKIYTCFFNYINGRGHPNAAEHREMANTLINYIGNNIKW